MILSPAHRAPGFEGLAGRTGRPPPTPGRWCYRQPRDVQDVIKVHATVPVLFLQKTLPLTGILKGTLHPKNSPPSSCPHTHMTPGTMISLSWPSPCSPGSHPELTAVPWGWAPCSPSSAAGGRIQKSLSWLFLFLFQ